nr:G-protein coupled receptor 84-like isoform X2 [Biomphalaria glabrata]
MNITVSKNYTTEEIQEYLSLLQHQSTLAFIPTLVYLSVLLVVGSTGNCLVLVVYCTKMTRTPIRIFIISMAVVDLFINIILIPGELYDMFHVWDFDLPILCKIRRFLNCVTIMFSILVLVAIAITRYRAVCCSPVKFVSIKQALIICVLISTISIILSINYGLLNGRQTKKTPNPQIFGHFCDIDDRYIGSKRFQVGTGIFVVFVLASTISSLASYAAIWCKVTKHNGVMNWKARFLSSEKEQKSIPIQMKTKTSFRQTTRMMLTITVTCFVAGYPFLGAQIYKTAHPEGYAVLEGVPLAMYHLFYRSYLLNSAVNPIIYILMDRTFRKECRTLLTNSWKCNIR